MFLIFQMVFLILEWDLYQDMNIVKHVQITKNIVKVTLDSFSANFIMYYHIMKKKLKKF